MKINKIFSMAALILTAFLMQGCASQPEKDSESYRFLQAHGLTDISVDESLRVSYRCGWPTYVKASFTAHDASGKIVSGVVCKNDFTHSTEIDYN